MQTVRGWKETKHSDIRHMEITCRKCKIQVEQQESLCSISASHGARKEHRLDQWISLARAPVRILHA